MKKLPIIILLLILYTACQQDKGKKLQSVKTKGNITNADIIRNPVSAGKIGDTTNLAKMVFEETNYEFGIIKEGEIIHHSYRFTNTGKIPLLISGARSTCGCTIPDYPRDPVQPGESGVIKVKFNSHGKLGTQKKPIYITANTYPSLNMISIEGEVIKEKK